MDDRHLIAWLHSRAGFGMTPHELDEAASAGVAATIDRLVDPDRHGVPAAPDPWTGLTFAGAGRAGAVAPIARWVDHLSSSPRPFEEWLVWFWHGHFATAVEKVKSPEYLVGQLRLFREAGPGPFAALLRAVTVDPAMLVWLDGRESTGSTPNENYGREVLELFALGLGNYAESDVQAGAKALTGWTVPKRARPVDGMAAAGARFRPGRHDDRPQDYLGRHGVHDVDTVVAAIAASPACARFVSAKLATQLLGSVAPAHLDRLAGRYSSSGLDGRDLARAVLELGVAMVRAGRVEPIVLAPVPWLASVLHQTGVTLDERPVVRLLGAAGQVPMDPPSVGGWPSGPAWFASATVAARYQLAGLIAAATPDDHPTRLAAAAGDHAALAAALNRPGGFSATTRGGLDQARSIDGPPGEAALALALVSPELVLA